MFHKIKEFLKKIKNRLLEFKLCLNEFFANKKCSKRARQSDLEGKILVITHSLEKGMGIKNTKVGYGKQKAGKLINFLFDYVHKGYPCDAFAFLEAVAVLKKYFELQDFWGEDVENLKQKFEKLCLLLDTEIIKAGNDIVAGYTVFKACELEDISKYHFEDFLKLRHSVRDYRDEVVPREVIEKAVKIANMGPSACNRQPAKVYCTKSKEEAEYIDSIITGTSGFKGCIPNFAIITEDRAYFTGPEQFQWYINGGIYTAYLSLALHSLGVSNIIMQWFAFYKTQDELKRFFNIESNEAIIAVIGYGYCADEIKCLAAQRKNVDDTIFFRD